jgi:chromosomal replication initiator protein
MDYTFTNFVVGASNQFAYTAALAVATQPATALYNPLVIHGRSGLGKTHLLHAISRYISQRAASWRILYLPAEHFMHALRGAFHAGGVEALRLQYQQADVFLMDDLQFIAGRSQTQEAFFATLNALFDAGKQVVVASDMPLQDITPLEARLRSRLTSGLVVDVQPPDLETRLAILCQKAEERSIALPITVATRIATYLVANVRELETCLMRLAAYASLHARRLDEDLTDVVLEHTLAESAQGLTMQRVQQTVAAYFGLQASELTAKDRRRARTFPRQVAMLLCRELTQASFLDISRAFGDRSHTTILHACAKLAQLEEKDSQVSHTLGQLRHSIRAETVEKCMKVFHSPAETQNCGKNRPPVENFSPEENIIE